MRNITGYSRVSATTLLLLFVTLSATDFNCYAAKKRFTVVDDIELAHFGDPYGDVANVPITISPNKQYFVAHTERGQLRQNRPQSSLYVFRMATIHHFVETNEHKTRHLYLWKIDRASYRNGPIISDIRWLSDSNSLAFLAKTASGTEQLFLADIKAKAVVPLTDENYDVTGYDVRDRNHYVFTVKNSDIRARAASESHKDSIVGTGRSLLSLMFSANLPFASKLYDLSDLWAVVNEKRFRVEDRLSGHPLHIYSLGQHTLTLSPDGLSVITAVPVRLVPPEWEMLYLPSRPASAYRIRAGLQDLQSLEGQGYVSEYAIVQLSTGAVQPLMNAPIGRAAGWWSAEMSAGWSADNKLVVLSNTFLSDTEGVHRETSHRPCVAVVDLQERHVTCIEVLKGSASTTNGWEDDYHHIDAVHFVKGDSRQIEILYHTIDGTKGFTRYEHTAFGEWITATTTGNGMSDSDGPVDISIKETFRDPPVLVATDRRTKVSRTILDPNPQLKDIDLGNADIYKWKDKRGRDWVGGLYEPSDFTQGYPYPLVIQTHGFNENAFRPDGIYPSGNAARELAAVGILVLQVPDCPYSIDIDEAQCNVEGYAAAVQQLVKDGLADPDRIGISGFSRSCYYVLSALAMSSLKLRAASITDGFNVGYLQYVTSVDLAENRIAHEADALIGAPPIGRGLDLWFARSPVFNMENVTAPLLMFAIGAPKLLVMWEPYSILRYLNKPVDLIVISEGTHVLSNPSQRLISQGGSIDWFRFWLKSEEDPDPVKAEQYARWRGLRKLQEENERKTAPAKESAN
ncbi:MAG TPA: hypothetical protein VFI45_02770 [Candidatus Acidoferrum sp.]|nr:hypothetical protein [Candidatus Acidoferrum sp.]